MCWSTISNCILKYVRLISIKRPMIIIENVLINQMTRGGQGCSALKKEKMTRKFNLIFPTTKMKSVI